MVIFEFFSQYILFYCVAVLSAVMKWVVMEDATKIKTLKGSADNGNI